MAKNFYFAWVDPGTTFNAAVHNVEDEDVFAHQFSHEEGNFAALTLSIRNPRIGLLNPGRKLWAFYSFNRAGVGEADDIVPLFYGRLIGVPDNVFSEVVDLNFTARPSDFVDQKMTLAETMKMLPYWDPIFISPDSWDDPDTVLEARSALWHIDPVTHVVSTSDILIGEDGLVDQPADDTFYDTMQLTLQEVPLTSVSVQATIPWTQTADGAVDFTQRLLNMWPFDEDAALNRSLIGSFTLEGLASDWPKSGSKIGSGWQVIEGSLNDVSYNGVKQLKVDPIFGGQLPSMAEGSILFPIKTSGTVWGGVDGAGFNLDYELVGVSMGYGAPRLLFAYTAKREYAQIVNFVLVSDQQPIATDSGEDEAMLLKVTANKVSDESYGGGAPIGDVRRRDYIHTPRGLQSIEYLILLARSHLVGRSRAVQITFETDFMTGLQYTLKKNAQVHDERIPGGTAVGKVLSISHALDGDDGGAVCQIVIGCAIGYGGSVIDVAGTPNYVDEGYVDREYQEYKDELVALPTSDIQYTVSPVIFDDDGLDFIKGMTDMNSAIVFEVDNPSRDQRGPILAAKDGDYADQAKIASLLQTIPTQITLQLKPMEGGPFVNNHTILTSELVVPQQIDLEAPSV